MAEEWGEKVHRAIPVVLGALRCVREPVTRDQLVSVTGCSDRIVRAAITELRRMGWLVVSLDGGGYRFAESREEVVAYLATVREQIRALEEVAASMEQAATLKFGPFSLEKGCIGNPR